MHNEFRNLRLKQLDRSLGRLRAAAKTPRPPKGWLRAIREAAGISASEVARMIKTSRHLRLQLERAEAEDRITIKSLRAAANALGCELVYALVPRTNSLQHLVEERARSQAKKQVLGVEHSMALENQAVGRVGEAVETETKRLLRKRGIR